MLIYLIRHTISLLKRIKLYIKTSEIWKTYRDSKEEVRTAHGTTLVRVWLGTERTAASV